MTPPYTEANQAPSGMFNDLRSGLGALRNRVKADPLQDPAVSHEGLMLSRRDFMRLGAAAVAYLGLSGLPSVPASAPDTPAGIAAVHAQDGPDGSEHTIAKDLVPRGYYTASNPRTFEVNEELAKRGMPITHHIGIPHIEEPVTPQELATRFKLQYIDSNRPELGVIPMTIEQESTESRLFLPMTLNGALIPEGYMPTPPSPTPKATNTPTVPPTNTPTIPIATITPIPPETKTPTPTPEREPGVEIPIIPKETKLYFAPHTYWGWGKTEFFQAEKGSRAIYRTQNNLIAVMIDAAEDPEHKQKRILFVRPDELGLDKPAQDALLAQLGDPKPVPPLERQLVSPNRPISYDGGLREGYVGGSIPYGRLHTTNGCAMADIAMDFPHFGAGEEAYYGIYDISAKSQGAAIVISNSQIYLSDNYYESDTGKYIEQLYPLAETTGSEDLRLEVTDMGTTANVYQKVWDEKHENFTYKLIRSQELSHQMTPGWWQNGASAKGAKLTLKSVRLETKSNVDASKDDLDALSGSAHPTYNLERIATYDLGNRIAHTTLEREYPPQHNDTETSLDTGLVSLRGYKRQSNGRAINLMSPASLANYETHRYENPPIFTINRALLTGGKVVPTAEYSKLHDFQRSTQGLVEYENFLYNYLNDEAAEVTRDANGNPIPIELDGLFDIDGKGRLVVKNFFVPKSQAPDGETYLLTDKKAANFVAERIKRSNRGGYEAVLVLPNQLRVTGSTSQAIASFISQLQAQDAYIRGVAYCPLKSTSDESGRPVSDSDGESADPDSVSENTLMFQRIHGLTAHNGKPLFVSADALHISPRDLSTIDQVLSLVFDEGNGQGLAIFDGQDKLNSPANEVFLVDKKRPDFDEFTPLREAVFRFIKGRAQAFVQQKP